MRKIHPLFLLLAPRTLSGGISPLWCHEGHCSSPVVRSALCDRLAASLLSPPFRCRASRRFKITLSRHSQPITEPQTLLAKSGALSNFFYLMSSERELDRRKETNIPRGAHRLFFWFFFIYIQTVWMFFAASVWLQQVFHLNIHVRKAALVYMLAAAFAWSPGLFNTPEPNTQFIYCDPAVTPPLTGSPITLYTAPVTNINYACRLPICRLRRCEAFPCLRQAGQNPEAGNVWQETVKLACCITHPEGNTWHVGQSSSWFINWFHVWFAYPHVQLTLCFESLKMKAGWMAEVVTDPPAKVSPRQMGGSRGRVEERAPPPALVLDLFLGYWFIICRAALKRQRRWEAENCK